MRKLSYPHASAVVRNYQRREEQAAGNGKRANKSAEVKICEAYLQKVHAEDQREVDKVLAAFSAGATPRRTQRRLDAFERTNHDLPVAWQIEAVQEQIDEVSARSACSETPLPAIVTVDVSGLGKPHVELVSNLAIALVGFLRATA